jgi:hypothetical protein
MRTLLFAVSFFVLLTLHWTQNICKPSFVTVRGKGKMERVRGGGGSKTSCALSLPLPPRTSAGWPTTYVFGTVNEARRYLATSITVAEKKSSIPLIPKPAIENDPEKVTATFHLTKIHLHVVLLPPSRSSKWLFPKKVPSKVLCVPYPSHPSHPIHISTHSVHPSLLHFNILTILDYHHI